MSFPEESGSKLRTLATRRFLGNGENPIRKAIRTKIKTATIDTTMTMEATLMVLRF